MTIILEVIAVWCLATGVTKLMMMLWGGGVGKARPMVERDIGDKEFNWDEGKVR